jgi:hypothetical protein
MNYRLMLSLPICHCLSLPKYPTYINLFLIGDTRHQRLGIRVIQSLALGCIVSK